jgi:hypothetical protein
VCLLQMAWLTQEQQRLAAGMQQQQLAVQMALQQRPWLGWTQPYALHSQPQVGERNQALCCMLCVVLVT